MVKQRSAPKRKLQAKGEITCMTAISPHVLTGEELRRVRLYSRDKGETFTLQTGKDTSRFSKFISHPYLTIRMLSGNKKNVLL